MHAKNEIVLVEDDEGMRQAIARMLRGSGYQVLAFDSAEALLDQLNGEAFWASCRCLVCDVRLPGASGFELYRRLADQGAMPPWIFITAHDDPAVRIQAERDGAAYLLKPFAGRALLALIGQAVHPR